MSMSEIDNVAFFTTDGGPGRLRCGTGSAAGVSTIRRNGDRD
jgi:hypothetical protein